MLRLRLVNDNDYDSIVECVSSCDNGYSDDNSVDNRSMETIMMPKGLIMMTSITMIVEGLTILMIMRAMAISWLMLT